MRDEEHGNKEEEIKNDANNFDEDFYLERYPDILKSGIDPFEHYINHGKEEGRYQNRDEEYGDKKEEIKNDANSFDEKFYLEKYPDILKSGIEPFEHYTKHGKEEGRYPNKEEEDKDKDEDIFDEDIFNIEFYAAYYDDLKILKSKSNIYKHWEKHGILEKRYRNISDLSKSIKFKFDLSKLNFKKIIELNPLFSELNKNEIYIQILQVKSINFLRLSDDIEFDASFYLLLGKQYLIIGQREKAHQILLYSLNLYSLDECNELLGNYFLDENKYKKALVLYNNISINQSVFLYANKNKIYRKDKRYIKALNVIVSGLDTLPHDTHLMAVLDDTINEFWEYYQDELHGLATVGKREILLTTVNDLVSKISRVYAKVFYSSSTFKVSLDKKRVLIIGDFHVSQCVRYRIDQKEEQLLFAGYEVKKISWTDLAEKYENIFFYDIIIYYRVPAMPVVIKSIEKAKSLGKITFFEIDDFLFDKVYPTSYETYGGNISMEEYNGLIYGMSLFREASKLCEYAIGSTLPLVALLEPLVSANKAYLHRNGLDSLNIYIEDKDKEYLNAFISKKDKKYINIFYGSGTLAHNSDFLELAQDAIAKILEENSNVKLTVVGHLNLPKIFINKFKDQITFYEKTETIEQYWSLLINADINLAVLNNDIINNSKSELKWFEAACFKIPSVVSDTQNYLDVVIDGEDALIASTSEDWYRALDKLIQNSSLRRDIGDKAYQKVMLNYSLKILSKNIDNIIKKVLDERIVNA